MSNAELKEFMYALKMELKAEIMAQASITDLVVVPKINEIMKKQDKTNGTVVDHEKRINERDWVCAAIQTKKVEETKAKDKREKVKFITQIIISAFAAALMLQYGILEFLKLVR